MGVVVRRYIDILTIIINFPYSTCISSFLVAASLLLCSFFKCFFGLVINFSYYTCISSFLAAASLLLCSFLKCFFGLVYVIFLQYISKRYSKNIRDR